MRVWPGIFTLSIVYKMRFSHTHKFLLVSNWKCGCSTMAGFFAPYSEFSGKENNKACLEAFGRTYGSMVHWPAVKIRKEFEKKGWKWDDYIKISTVRNPWARIVSLFFYARRGQKIQNVRAAFTRFVKQEVPKWQHGIRNRWNSYEMFHDKKGKKIIDYVVRLEHLQEDLDPIIEKHFPGIAPFDYTKKSNTTDHMHYSYYYTPQTREIVRRIFQYDIRKYKYKFEPVMG